MMPLISLPVELLILVSDNLAEPDLNSLAKASRYLYAVFNPILWTSARDNERTRAVRKLARAGIIRAAGLDNEEAVRKFIRMRIDVNQRDPLTGLTPLQIAARHGHTRIVKLLLGNGAVMSETNPDDSVVVAAIVSEDAQAMLDVLLRHDIPDSAFQMSVTKWRLHPPSTIRPLRKHFTSSFLAGYRDVPDDEWAEELSDLLVMYAVLDHDLKDVQAILESAPDHHGVVLQWSLLWCSSSLGLRGHRARVPRRWSRSQHPDAL